MESTMIHPLKKLINDRKSGIKAGIPSYCSSNEFVIEVALERAMKADNPVLIEATANQVNQYGGYTGMKPKDFRDYVMKIADQIGINNDLIILGGDHLGPLTWKNESEVTAMEKAKILVHQYVSAGFTKIHLDTSMKLADDSTEMGLPTEIIARRGVQLYISAMEAFEDLQKKDPSSVRPVFVIGSEVPIPGGAQEHEDAVNVTRPVDFEDTVDAYKRAFKEFGIADAWSDVIAVVVQPGVEFGDEQVFTYDRETAKQLCDQLKNYPDLVFEGHSTDYQRPESLREMVEDGIAILKVGPALTFALREALFALDIFDNELTPIYKQAKFIETLEAVMVEKPENWIKHLHGDSRKISLARKYSYSDRCRYYLGEKEVLESINKVLDNLSNIKIPMNILRQFMPIQYRNFRDGKSTLNPRALAKDAIAEVMKEYEFATPKYTNTHDRICEKVVQGAY